MNPVQAARAILEHWLAKDDRSEIINKDSGFRVAERSTDFTAQMNINKTTMAKEGVVGKK